MESETLPSTTTTTTMLLHTNDYQQQSQSPASSSDTPMNQFSDVYPSRQSTQTNNNNNNNNSKTNKRKLDEIADPTAAEFDASYSLKPPKIDQNEPERSLSRTGTRMLLIMTKTKQKKREKISNSFSSIQRSPSSFNTITKW